LALLILAGLVIGGIAYWSYKKVKKEIKENKPKLEQWRDQMEKAKEGVEQQKKRAKESTFEEEPETAPSGGEAGIFPVSSERQMGYVKKVYAKSGKNYLNIDYIQWLTGDAAERAMREDRECPKTGECIVLNDYYIRNVNPLIRTFEISPDVQIFMQTYGAGEPGGDISWNQPITFSQFWSIFTTSAKPHLKNVPYIVEIQNQEIVKITEQYIP
jgi:uncharacterized protein YneF (UPF0154 family)